ncbi:organic solute transporter Ostalpha-domain-containing protein [Penicillium argentinense]|uniref:Organic solute transporter Ostalpha-domain-containing protein n=1 Tax=Penicillium argentinense TaxID=1131581 RepID=A0A9W9G3B4_9EURO|nr:organic solute transporter Ostalpha-domain-containing protein [Penicillium argentinense]KAJ5111341.1 organic solute transporter Ostalpha-domain-containing protein [Penicillium argentinense]
MIFGLMAQHAMRMGNPNQQLKIMRICHLIPSFQAFSYAAICFPNSWVYLQGFTEAFQGIAIYAFLINGLDFLNLTWWSVLQYPVVAIVTAFAQLATQAAKVYCVESNPPKFAHIWLQVLIALSTSVAVNAILQFYMHMKGYMKEHIPLLKLTILFLILAGVQVLKETKILSYADVHMGIPTMVICVEMVPPCFPVVYACSTKPYTISHMPRLIKPGSYHPLGEDGDQQTMLGGELKRYQGS